LSKYTKKGKRIQTVAKCDRLVTLRNQLTGTKKESGTMRVPLLFFAMLCHNHNRMGMVRPVRICNQPHIYN